MKGLPYFLDIATAKSISAILFMFQPRKNADRTTLNACTGWVRRMGRFYESRAYTLVFHSYTWRTAQKGARQKQAQTVTGARQTAKAAKEIHFVLRTFLPLFSYYFLD